MLIEANAEMLEDSKIPFVMDIFLEANGNRKYHDYLVALAAGYEIEENRVHVKENRGSEK